MTTSAGRTYEIFCGWDVQYNDDPATYAETMEDCIDACDAFVPNPPGESYDQPCVAVSFTSLYPTGLNCYLVCQHTLTTHFQAELMHLQHYSTEYQQASASADAAILVSNGTAPSS